MKTLFLSFAGASLVLFSAIGCADVESTAVTDEPTASTEQKYVTYRTLYDIYTLTNGTNRVDYYSDAQAAQNLGLPIAVGDNSTDPDANSGWIVYQMTPDMNSAAVMYVSDFSSMFTVPVGGVVTKHSFYMIKPLYSRTWHATWGQGGPWGSFGYYASYALDSIQ